ncbi:MULTISPECIES: hypothetical protein [Burkholderia]|uniref:hypothetical protein n=1 Tax=Burkholderia TaxID=32008 RepID=UPI0011781A6F|nr:MULTISPECIES: hypothetical protein [Burkholderia]MBY4722280.1 hypothetical protein [Burkholderia contaminans]MCI3971363.1 hypothetical protein [Burkholderia sp. HI4860]MDN7786515.1 hypothetical protein [Burkholderia contaminans]
MKRFHARVKRTIFFVNNTVPCRFLRFSATSVSIEIDPIRDENHLGESDTQNPRTIENIHYCSMNWGALPGNT